MLMLKHGKDFLTRKDAFKMLLFMGFIKKELLVFLRSRAVD